MQTGNQAPAQGFPAGCYAYGLNIFLEGTNGFISTNSKRMERRFRLTSVNTAFLTSVDDWSLILGTEQVNWFAGFVRAETILGDGALPHFVPEEGMIVEAGDYIVCQARSDSTETKRIALIFQGVHI
jgi:hypothetical protein